jgi:hypothetical protein
VLGQRNDLSDRDIEKVRTFYGCTAGSGNNFNKIAILLKISLASILLFALTLQF